MLSTVRRQMRARRRAVSGSRAADAATRAARRLWRHPALARAARIAFYVARDGELDCGPAIDEGWARGRQLLLPALRGQVLWFARYTPDSPMAENRFGIPEPVVSAGHFITASRIDVIVAPLLAWDAQGTRLGMGGGFYDRTLALRRRRDAWRQPRVIGYAYSFQQVEDLARRRWDVPLDTIVTEKEHIDFRRG